MPSSSAALSTCRPHPDPIHTEGLRLGTEITGLCGYLYAATYRLLVLIREFDREGYWEWPGLCSCAHWLNFKCGIGMNAAREKVRVAHALAGLPKISEAFRRGELSYSKVRAMMRIADAANEDYLLMIARHGTGSSCRAAGVEVSSLQTASGDRHGECAAPGARGRVPLRQRR